MSKTRRYCVLKTHRRSRLHRCPHLPLTTPQDCLYLGLSHWDITPRLNSAPLLFALALLGSLSTVEKVGCDQSLFPSQPGRLSTLGSR